MNAIFLDRPSPQLRKQNKIKTIQSSLRIEGNTLTEEQITALLENKRVIGSRKDIEEVVNAISIYEQLDSFDPFSIKSFLNAHKVMMKELMKDAGKYRNKGVGIVKGENLQHLAPPHSNVPSLMNDLVNYLKNPDELCLIKSSVFHYKMELIHQTQHKYHKSLSVRDKTGKSTVFIEYILGVINESLKGILSF